MSYCDDAAGDERIRMAGVCGEYRRVVGEPCPASHRKLVQHAQDGLIAAEQDEFGKWSMRRRDVAPLQTLLPILHARSMARMRHRGDELPDFSKITAKAMG
jgi:hypothetical protein